MLLQMMASVCVLFLLSFHFVSPTSIIGLWHINDKGYPLQTGTTLLRSAIIVSQESKSDNECATLSIEYFDESLVEHNATITQCKVTQSFFINNTILFDFCVANYNCFQGKIVGGIMTGHQCKSMNEHNCSSNKPNTILPFSGWNQLYFDTEFAFRSQYNSPTEFLLTIYPLNKDINNGLTSYCHLRIDYNETNKQYIGRYKIFHQLHANSEGGEMLEYDLKINKWNGTYINFMLYPDVNNQSVTQTFEGNVNIITPTGSSNKYISRNISGIYTDTRYPSLNAHFNGIRWNILTPGLISNDNKTAFTLWQNLTRQYIEFLTMFGNPEPKLVSSNVTKVNVSGSGAGLHRDDNYVAHPQNYDIYNVTLYFQIPNYYDDQNMFNRKVHGYFALPFNKSVDKFVLSVNGHSGSSYQMMFTPNGTHDWYGDAYARRDYIELSMDDSHRNVTPLYHDHYNQGDDPQHDNAAHPAIMNFYEGWTFSDYEEDGERVYDAYHATKWFLSSKYIKDYNIDDNKRYVTGHSMGGEVTTYLGALFSHEIFKGGVLPGGFSPDLDVMYYHGNHPCWRFTNSNIREHISTAVLHGLIVPNLLIVLTGQQDTTYSNHNPPYSADKQVMRRTREYGKTYIDSINDFKNAFTLDIFHYLHFDQHHYHVGDIDDGDPSLTHLYVQLSNIIKPNYFNDIQWEIIANTSSVQSPVNQTDYFNLFDLLNYYQN